MNYWKTITILSIIFFLVTALAVAMMLNLFGANWSPNAEAVRADFLQAASASTAGQGKIIINDVTVGDGWSDGVEVQVRFDILPLSTTTLMRGIFSGLQINADKPLENGMASLSYSFVNDEWKHLTTGIQRMPTE